MRFLQLQNNTLGGKIPSNLSSCSNLEALHVAYNFLDGEIPKMLGTLSKLWFYASYRNNLIEIIFSFLKSFSVGENNLGGIIPDAFDQLTKLIFFVVGRNRLTSNNSFLNVQFVFAVAINQIQGHLPLDIGITLPNMERLNLQDLSQFQHLTPQI